MEVTKIKRKSLSEMVLDSIVEYIESNNLQVGDKIPTEGQFIEMLGVSRSSVREAIKALSMNGALESIPGKGTFIRSDISEVLTKGKEDSSMILAARASIKEIMEIRTALELLAFDLAIERGTEQDIAYVQEAMDSLVQDVRSGKPWAASGSQFHIRIAEMSGNDLLVDMINSLSATIGRYKDALFSVETKMAPYIQEHQNILDALRAKDKKAGHKAINDHMKITENDIAVLVNADTASTFIDIGKIK